MSAAPGPFATESLRWGARRNVARSIHPVSCRRARLATRACLGEAEAIAVAWTGAIWELAARPRCSTSWRTSVCGTKERRHGTILRSLEARDDLRVQSRHGAVHQQFRSRKYRPDRTNVWDDAGITSLGGNRMTELGDAPYGEAGGAADAIRDRPSAAGIVLDMFGGSGTTLIAARKCGASHVDEHDPAYCDTIIWRYELHSGSPARLMCNGIIFQNVPQGMARTALPIRRDGASGSN